MQTDAARAAGGFRLGAAESAGNMRLGGENIAGNAITGGANAQAAGVVGGANAWNQALGGFNQTAQNLWTLDQLRPRPQQPQGGFQQQPVAGVNTQIVQPGYRIGG